MKRYFAGRAALAAAVALALTAAAPAALAGKGSGGSQRSSSCQIGATSTPFVPWGDTGSYGLAPGGSFEGGISGWTLSGGASVVSGNEPWYVGSKKDTRSLALPEGSSATTSPICIPLETPVWRVFYASEGLPSGQLRVEVLVHDQVGAVTVVPVGSLSAVSAWRLSPYLLLPRDLFGQLETGQATVQLRFRADQGSFRIDDVYVDPFKLT